MKKEFEGFDTISVTDIPDCESTGIYLRHRKTGLEVFHLLNSDKENLFAFAFRTPADDSTGAPHILEHSVLCGSEKFPLKEPFVNLLNQSMATFLNAMTYPDKTVYPASSMNRTDYFHLMDVYADAVFFPLLKKETFMQEAHRLEPDDQGSYSLQGVVYNEMKGNYSAFTSIAISSQLKSLQHGTVYDNDSGGDPLAIPSFTYKQFLAFHKKYYSPSNCLVFLYGNIPTEDQLRFLQKNVLDRLEKKYPVPPAAASYPVVPGDLLLRETTRPLSCPGKEFSSAPVTGAHGSTAVVNWLCGNTDDLDSYMECIFLSIVLGNRDSAPLSKALLESHLGENLAPASGAIAAMRTFTFSSGLSGVKKEDAGKAQDLVLSVLQDLYKKGIAKNDIDSAVLAMDFWNREVVRAGGPFALVLMGRALNGWNYGTSPTAMLGYRASFEKIQKHLSSEPRYTEELIRRYLLDNQSRMFTVVSPEASYIEDRNKKEAEMIEKLSGQTDEAEVKRETDMLHAYQQHKETAAETACIPSIHPTELSPFHDPIGTEVTFCPGADGSDVCLFLNREPANGIVYVDVGFPVDVLAPSDYPYLPLFTFLAMGTGWNGKNWAECESEIALCSGGINISLNSSSVSETPAAKKAVAAAEGKNYIGRDWIFFTIKMPVEKTAQALNLFSEALLGMDFIDTDRMKNLVLEARTNFHSSIIPSGSQYAVSRASSAVSHAKAANEIWNGLSQLYALEKIMKEDIAEVGKKFTVLTEKFRRAGAIIHVTTDNDSMKTVLPSISDFSVKTGLCSLVPKPQSSDGRFFEMIKLPGEKTIEKNETCVLTTQTGFAAASIPYKCVDMRDSAVEGVLSHWLSSHPLWDKIRTSGGAYGASAFADGLDNRFVFNTYRDPSPQRSLEIFREALSEAASSKLGKEETERAITGTYNDENKPYSPSVRGTVGFKWVLYAIPESDIDLKLHELLSITEDDIKKFAERLLQYDAMRHTAIICDKSVKTDGPVIELPV